MQPTGTNRRSICFSTYFAIPPGPLPLQCDPSSSNPTSRKRAYWIWLTTSWSTSHQFRKEERSLLSIFQKHQATKRSWHSLYTRIPDRSTRFRIILPAVTEKRATQTAISRISWSSIVYTVQQWSLHDTSTAALIGKRWKAGRIHKECAIVYGASALQVACDRKQCQSP